MATMKAVRFHQYGDPSVLVYEDVATPEPGAGEVLIRVEASGVNFADTMRRYNDQYPEDSPLPFTAGVDVAGTVEKVGPGVTGLGVGTPVFAAPGVGGYAQFVVVPAAQAIPLPGGLDPGVATALLLQGLTASLALSEAGRLQTGEWVLIQAAAGGVGSLAVQLAKQRGARVIGMASNEAKRDFVLSLGANAVVDSLADGWPQLVRSKTDGRGVDLVLEMTGHPVVENSLSVLAPFGRMVVFGLASRQPVSVNPAALLVPNQSIIGFYIGPYFARPALIQQSLGELIGKTLSGELKVKVGLRLPLAEAQKAHQLLEARETTGKIVLEPWTPKAA